MPDSLLLPDALTESIKSLKKFAIAYSGGLDSRFLAHSAALCGCDVLLINVRGPHISRHEHEWAARWAASHGFRLEILYCNPLDNQLVAANDKSRCYHCKKRLLSAIISRARELGFATVCDGGNADDRACFRPGQRAVRECGIISPLSDLPKAAIREYARASGLELPDQPSGACLLTRLAYGMQAEPKALAAISECEHAIAAFLSENGGDNVAFRLRLTPAPLVQIEPGWAGMAAKILGIAAEHGYAGATFAETEKVSGYFDKGGMG